MVGRRGLRLPIGITLLAVVMLSACSLVVPPASENSCTPLGCPGGTVHLTVKGLSDLEGQTEHFWLVGTGSTGSDYGTELRSHDLEDVPPGTYRAFVPEPGCKACSEAEIAAGPVRCESSLEIGGVGDTVSVEVTLDAARPCSIRVSP
jgi:hypothetical protein